MAVKKQKVCKEKCTMPYSTEKNDSFWNSKSSGELASEQGVKPIKDITELFGYWPKGADFDSFYEAAVASRKHADAG